MSEKIIREVKQQLKKQSERPYINLCTSCEFHTYKYLEASYDQYGKLKYREGVYLVCKKLEKVILLARKECKHYHNITLESYT